MKIKILALIVMGLSVVSCNKIEEIIQSTVSSAKQTAQEKTTEMVQKQVNDQLGNLANAENIQFDTVFPHSDSQKIENETGKKLKLPNGTMLYLFKYRASDKDLLLKSLVNQTTTDEAKSKKEAQKIDGAAFLDKIDFFARFLPANTFDLSFLDELRNNPSIEYYKIRRFPHASTVIFNTKTNTVYQFVEAKQ